jgi:hypothetical protein
MNSYEIGTIFNLDNKDEEYMIVGNLEKEDNVYLLSAPLNADESPELSSAFLLKVNKNTNGVEYCIDEDIAQEVLKNVLETLK